MHHALCALHYFLRLTPCALSPAPLTVNPEPLNPEPLNPYNKKVFNRMRQMGGLKTFLSMISGDPKKEITFSYTDREIWRGLDLF